MAVSCPFFTPSWHVADAHSHAPCLEQMPASNCTSASMGTVMPTGSHEPVVHCESDVHRLPTPEASVWASCPPSAMLVSGLPPPESCLGVVASCFGGGVVASPKPPRPVSGVPDVELLLQATTRKVAAGRATKHDAKTPRARREERAMVES
jgi:hypothetical protein